MGDYFGPYRKQRHEFTNKDPDDPDFLIYKGQISLWHQCDGWFIGTPNDARALIADLHRAIKYLEEHQSGVVA